MPTPIPSEGPPAIVDKSVVITGAGAGIGRALAARLSAAGARVVVNDVDGEAAELVAAEVGGTAVAGDCASEQGIAALVAAAVEAQGPVDVYIANAGAAGVGGLEASDETWQRTLDLNLMAHVRAARLLVPDWLERGGGRFVVTASAAGLLTMPGAAAYSASKHAAVAFAEWLSMTYRERGIVVQALCPQAVQTAMLADVGDLVPTQDLARVLSPAAVAEATMDALADDRFLILPHPEAQRFYVHRATDTDRWLTTMAASTRHSDTS